MYILGPIGIVLGLIVMISYLVWRFRCDARDKQKKLDALIEGVAAIDLKRMPQLAATFGHYVHEVFGVELAQMEFAEHVKYIGKHLRKLSKRDYSTYFPGGENEFVAAVIADLGELVIARYHAKWIRGDESPYCPFVGIEFTNGKKTCCNPGGAVLMQLVNGDECGAVIAMINPFENPDQVQTKITEIANSYCVTKGQIQIELDKKLLDGMKYSRWAIYGMLLFFTVGPTLLFIAEPNRKGLALLALSGIVLLILIGLFIKDRWMMYDLVRYERLVLEQDHFRLEGAKKVLKFFYAEITFCKIGEKASELNRGPEIAKFLNIKADGKRLTLLENYFLNHNAAKEVFAEIARRVNAAKGGGFKP